MRLKFLGHACFELISDDGIKIVFDPYEAGSYDGALSYGPVEGDYDIAVVSHDHADHRDEEVLSGIKNVVESKGDFSFSGIKIKTFPTFHDKSEGSERGNNLISLVDTGRIRLAHLGDLGHDISLAEIPELENVDIMMIPVGGYFTIDAAEAHWIVEEFSPKIVIPMHFKTEKVGFPIESVDKFLELENNVEKTGGSELDINEKIFGDERRIIMLEPAL
ncbi:MAG: MBL fold metallo-hydrolase [Candidatus Krumholzibacteriota bacterium]|nr:MBL fold metallo-hydrolase [Candidatus Krumholzibacteriota bacterium]